MYPHTMSWTELTQNPNFPLWTILLGLALVVLAALLVWRKTQFFRHSQLALAHNVSFNKRSALEGNLWQTTVEFTDAQDKPHKLEYTSSAPYPLFAKMDKVRVYYDPDNPEKAYAYTFWKVWSVELALSSVALLLLLIGVGNFYYG